MFNYNPFIWFSQSIFFFIIIDILDIKKKLKIINNLLFKIIILLNIEFVFSISIHYPIQTK